MCTNVREKMCMNVREKMCMNVGYIILLYLFQGEGGQGEGRAGVTRTRVYTKQGGPGGRQWGRQPACTSGRSRRGGAGSGPGRVLTPPPPSAG